MSKKIPFPLKAVLFAALAFVFAFLLSKILINDLNTYTRCLMHDLYSQEKIDILFAGASHVSHGINPEIADKKLNLSVMNTGTPNQNLNATCTILTEAARLYNLKDVFVELDFATAATTPYSKSEPSKSTFLVAHYIKNPKAELNLILSSTSPKYYLNSFFPLGKEKLVDLNPKSVFEMAKSRITGEYWKYKYESSDSVYVPKGCVLDETFVENGTFYSEPVNPIPVSEISDEWKETIVKIIKFCRGKNIRISFYQNPSTDFYLTEKGNYDEYVALIRNLLSEYDVPYYDFSFLKPEYLSLSDSDFFDDNHLNKEGIEKFTNVFCDFYRKNDDEREKMFYSSFAEKTAAQNPKIYGLILDEDKDAGLVKVSPVQNHCDGNLIAYDVSAVLEGEENRAEQKLAEKSKENVFYYPKNSSGKIKITAFYNGEEQAHVEKYYSAL